MRHTTSTLHAEKIRFNRGFKGVLLIGVSVPMAGDIRWRYEMFEPRKAFDIEDAGSQIE
jgi:hypothetical protein